MLWCAVEMHHLSLLQTTGKVLPEWGFYQNEVATDKDHHLDSEIFNVEEHRYSQSTYW